MVDGATGPSGSADVAWLTSAAATGVRTRAETASSRLRHTLTTLLGVGDAGGGVHVTVHDVASADWRRY